MMMKKCLIVFIFLFASFNSFCQDFDPILCEPCVLDIIENYDQVEIVLHYINNTTTPCYYEAQGFSSTGDLVFFDIALDGSDCMPGLGGGFGCISAGPTIYNEINDGPINCNGPTIPIFTDVTPPAFNSIITCDAQIGDIDNDGDVDIVIGDYIARNNNGSFSLTNYPNAEVNGKGSILDINQDGWLDHIGAKISLNQSGSYFASNSIFPGSSYVDLLDFDNDGLVSILADVEAQTNCSSFFPGQCILYDLNDLSCLKNIEPNSYNIATDFNGDMEYELLTNNKVYTDFQSNIFVLNTLPFNIQNSKSINLNNDGKVDIINSGTSGDNPIEIMLNNGSVVKLLNNTLSQVHVADINNDGQVDILNQGVYFKNTDQMNFTFFNNLAGFSSFSNLIKPLDYDNDGDLDLLVIPRDVSPKLFRNESTIKNTKPNRPQNLQANISDNKVMFAWTHGGDDLTNYPTYNLYIKNLTTNKVMYFPYSDTLTGKLRFLDKGNCEYNNGWFLQNLPPGKYRWKVQAVDQGYLGSEWAEGADFEIVNEPIVILALPSQFVKYQDTFSIPVVVTGFQDILSFQFPITWDTTKLELIEVHSLNKKLPNYIVQPSNFGIRKGEIYTGYTHPDDILFSLNTFDTLFSIQFKAISQGCDHSVVSLPHVINYPPHAQSFKIEIIDKNLNALTYITSDAHITIQKDFYQSFSICSSETVQVGSNTYNMQGIYMDTLQSSTGCDSIITTTITLLSETTYSQEIQICQGETVQVGSNTYNMQGIYMDTLQSSLGCDSIVTTTITLKPGSAFFQEVQICQGESFSVGNNTYTMQGMYIDTLQSSIGCDSIVTTTISYKPKTSYSQEIQICQGESISVGNNTYTMQGMYIDTLQSSIGCDSIVATTITFKPDATYSQEIQICQGESITVGTKSYTVSGSYVDTLIAKNGCDSIVQTYLNVRQTQVTDDIIVICSGQSHFVASNIYTQSGNYIDTLQSIYGCDSIINTFLTVRSSKNKAIPIADTITLCLKDTIINPYSFLDQYEANGTWTLDEKNISGEPFNLKELPDGIHTINYGFFQQAPCPDKDTSFILVVKDCSIMDCSFMVKDDSIRVNKNESSEISLTINDILPEEYIISIISVNPEILESTNLSDQGLYSFTVTGDFGEIVQVVYEICTPDCADCKQGSLWIDNEALKDIIRTNIILPNTSGKNATLRFTDEEILLDSELYIFNRNGDRIFYMKDYDNSWNADGYPGGIYYYVLRYRGVDVKKTLTVIK